MSEPFLAEIKMVGFNFAPRGWAFCDGQILPISQNQSLFSLLGTAYGGDGRTSFALPDLRGRVPTHVGSRLLGTLTGEETHALTEAEIPSHTHTMRASGEIPDVLQTNPIDALHASTSMNRRPVSPYTGGANLTPMSSTSGSDVSSAHNNMQPFTAIAFVIALQGLFPSRN